MNHKSKVFNLNWIHWSIQSKKFVVKPDSAKHKPKIFATHPIDGRGVNNEVHNVELFLKLKISKYK